MTKPWAKLSSCDYKACAKEVIGGTVEPRACRTKFDAAMTKAGAACRYLDSGNGTVTDLDTGLMWQKTDDNGGVTDKDNTYTWSDRTDGDETDPDGTVFTVFLAALNHCTSSDGTATSGGFAGHYDWRIPQIDELQTIVNCSFGNPCVDQSSFGVTNSYSLYWSASAGPTCSQCPESAWAVSFGNGEVVSLYTSTDREVRGVRCISFPCGPRAPAALPACGELR